MSKLIGSLFGTAAGIAAIVGAGFLVVLGIGGCNNFNRSQALKDAHNRVKISAIEIQNQAQRVKIARQQADIRYVNATGIRRAQDEIQKTLTPLYVQWEAIQAQLSMANSPNHTMIYIPVGANGVPLVSPVGTQTLQQAGK